MKAWIGRIAFVLVLSVIGIVVVASFTPLPGDAITPAGFKRNSAHYVAARDGTRIAIDVWLPPELATSDRIPALVEGSRYWRDTGVTLAGRILHLFGGEAPGTQPGAYAGFFTARGYAYVSVEVRGTGASFGMHETEYSLQEMTDYAAILDWIVARSWSNGRVGSVGVSYAGTTAELMTTTHHPALRAAAPLYSDFDAQYHLVTPGGIYQPAFVEAWSRVVLAMDRNDLCTVMRAQSALECGVGRLLVGGIKPVDGPEGRLLKDAIDEHDSPDPTQLVSALRYRDSRWGDVPYSSLDSQAYGRKTEIEASGVPMYVVAGWFDAATVEGTLARFASFSNRQTVFIGPFSHGGGYDTDPFREADAPPVWSRAEQLDRLEAFFAAHLKDEGDPPPGGLSYYVMGGEVWRTTDRWPPAGFSSQRFFLLEDSRLSPEPPPAPSSAGYPVDFTVGTEPQTRWMTQLGGSDVIYDNRADAIAGTIGFLTEPFEAPMELTGSVVLDLYLTSDQPDGAVHAYLDAVGPDGTMHYLTEGVLRLKHRRVSAETPVYPHFGPYHSFLEQDAADMQIGRPELVSLGLFSTSARIPTGYRLRLSLAGADATSFARVPHDEPAPNWRVHHGGTMPSRLTVPLRPWNAEPGDSQKPGESL